MSRSFGVTWDYRCPFARNANEHLMTGLAAGADWDVRFVAFSLEQAHIEEGGQSVWEEPERYPALLPMLAGLAVREREPEKFLAAHAAIFDIRHEHGLDLRDRDVVAKALDDVGVDGSGVLSEIDAGWPLDVLQNDHTEAVKNWDVFGVPTFISGDEAAFVRVMHRPAGDAPVAIATIDRVLDQVDGWIELNEFKRTKVLR
jgi:predicted DsbA family dithiol-disulfide isomerase